MDHYKSWSDLKKWLEGNLCQSLQGRVTFFLTRYHKVHNSYGRAAIKVDGAEWVIFSWIEMYRQEWDTDRLWRSEGCPREDIEGCEARYERMLKAEWDEKGTYSEMDFLSAALAFRNLSIQAALEGEDYIIKILAVLDKRIGVRTLKKLAQTQEYLHYPDWVRQFYLLRLSQEHII